MTHVMLLALWAAAIYRLGLSIRLPLTLWRTSFTFCMVCVALAATATVYADAYIERPLRAWNLTFLLVHLLLLLAAGSCMVYIVTLRRESTPTAAVHLWILLTLLVGALQVASWWVAPIHTEPYSDLITKHGQYLSVAVFNISLYVFLMLTTAATAHISFARILSPGDLTRTVSLGLTGVSCAAAAVMFGLWVAATALSYARLPFNGLRTIGDRMMPFVLVVLALGTLSLLLAPPLLDYLRTYRLWRTLRPLWLSLVSLQPSIHLNLQPRGTPSRRIQTRLQRAVVEIYDALRLTRVDLRPGASIDELGQALRHPSPHGPAAADVLTRTTSRDAEIAQLIDLARTYARSTP